MSEVPEESNEVSLSSVYAVVYQLNGASWDVSGEGWSEVHLYRDETDFSHRIVGWTVSDQQVVINASINGSCEYSCKTEDFHKFVDENKTAYGFGFYKVEESFQQATRFMNSVLEVIRASRAVGATSGKGSIRLPAGPHHAKHMSLVLDGTSGTQQAPPSPLAVVRERAASMDSMEQSRNNAQSFSSPLSPSNRASVAAAQDAAPTRPASMSESKEAKPDFHGRHSNALSAIIQEDAAREPFAPLGKLKILPSKPAKLGSSDPASRPAITDPYGVVHTQHVAVDPRTGQYRGLPPDWEKALQQQFGLPPNKLETRKLDAYNARIPIILITMRDYLFTNRGDEQVGIFRLAPDAEECNFVKEQLNKGSFRGCNDINCISNLIKVWFRDLPQQLLQPVDSNLIQQCAEEEDALRIMDSLPEPNKSIYLWLLDLCVDIAAKQNINKMTPQNLAIVIAPNLFKPDALNLQPMQALVFSQKVAHFLFKSVCWRQKIRYNAN